MADQSTTKEHAHVPVHNRNSLTKRLLPESVGEAATDALPCIFIVNVGRALADHFGETHLVHLDAQRARNLLEPLLEVN